MTGPESPAAPSGGDDPCRVRPEALRPRLRDLDGWPASASALFDWLRERVRPDILREIANEDYGHKADEHHAALREICSTGLLPTSATWEPFEVIRLYRWGNADTTDHVARALSCVLLMLVPDSDPVDPVMTTGPILVESCLALGSEATQLGEQFFAWFAESEDLPSAEEQDQYGSTRADQPAALLLLFLLRASTEPGDARLDGLSRMLAENGAFDPWRVGFEIVDSTSARPWSRLVLRILEPLRATYPPVARVLDGLDLDRLAGC